MKKHFVGLIAIPALVIGFIFIPKSSSSIPSCPFCDETILKRQTVYTDDLVTVLYTHKPITKSHFLIIPNRHVERLEELSIEELNHVHQAINKVHLASQKILGTSPYLIHQKNGREVGQSVPHIHFHYIGKRSGDYSIVTFGLKLIWAQLRGPLSSERMMPVIESMQQAFASFDKAAIEN